MYTVSLLDAAALNPHMRHALAELTEPKLQRCLEGEPLSPQSYSLTVAIGAFQDDIPVGLLLANLKTPLHLAEIHSLFVHPKHRNRKVASQMLSLLEQEALQKECPVISMIYPSASLTTPFLEQLLRSHGWAAPRLFSIHCRFDGPVFHPPWLSQEYPLSDDFQLFPWKDLQPKEREKLLYRAEQLEILGDISPFREEKLIEPLNSLGLRYQNEVIGWMITHREAPDTIHYFALYIVRAFQYRKEAIKLLQESIRLQQQSSVRWGVLDVNIARTEHSWLKFVKQRLIPYAESVSYTKQSYRWIT